MRGRTSALATETLALESDQDVVRARHVVRRLSLDAGLRLIDQTKLVTAVSELARNTVVHGGGGRMSAGLLEQGGRSGVWALFEESGMDRAFATFAKLEDAREVR